MTKIALTAVQSQDNQQSLLENAILTTVDNLYDQIKTANRFSPTVESHCCLIKVASLLSAQSAASHPADLLITASLVTQNFAVTLLRLYEQMPAPKFVITLGGCSPIEDSFTPVARLIPVDISLSECPLSAETLLSAIARLDYS